MAHARNDKTSRPGVSVKLHTLNSRQRTQRLSLVDVLPWIVLVVGWCRDGDPHVIDPI